MASNHIFLPRPLKPPAPGMVWEAGRFGWHQVPVTAINPANTYWDDTQGHGFALCSGNMIAILLVVLAVVGMSCAIIWWPCDKNARPDGAATVINPTTTVRGAGIVREQRLSGVAMNDHHHELQLLPQTKWHSGQWIRGLLGKELYEQPQSQVGFRRALDGTMAVVLRNTTVSAEQVEVRDNVVTIRGIEGLSEQGTFVPSDFSLEGTIHRVVVDLTPASDNPSEQRGPAVTITCWEQAYPRVSRDNGDLVVYLLTQQADQRFPSAVAEADAEPTIDPNDPMVDPVTGERLPMTALDIQNTGRYVELVLAKWKPSFSGDGQVGFLRHRVIRTLAVIGTQSLGNPDYKGENNASGLFGFQALHLQQAFETGRFNVRIENCAQCTSAGGKAAELNRIVMGQPQHAIDMGVELWKLMDLQGKALSGVGAEVFQANPDLWTVYGLFYGHQAMVEAIANSTVTIQDDPKMIEYQQWVELMGLWADAHLTEDLAYQAYGVVDDPVGAPPRATRARVEILEEFRYQAHGTGR